MKAITFCGIFLILTLLPFYINYSYGDGYEKTITVEDLGVLQLAAHDLFNVDRCNGNFNCSTDFENGKLDLSTLFVDTANGDDPFSNEIIAIGGEPRNRENIMLFTVASEFGLMYVDLVENGVNPEEAKQIVIDRYHTKLAKVYQKTFHESFPSPIEGEATMDENLALRTIHDFLPGTITIDNAEKSTLDPSLNAEKLDKKELKQKSSKLDGTFDDEFLDIDICFPPDFSVCIEVDLLEADQSFGEQFMTQYSFDELLEELEDGRYDKNDKAMSNIRNLMAKGQNF